ncbi:methyl-accepting chemotaxis protein [Rhodoferax ferrireducens]|uniref:Methyl-accepting chemotaxis protein n=1 Tax=Rhodoferax ferrireducens TaxID=192843 RepID=A0ABU2C6Q1_9BURK|nr:methyl-accepting chemotaxis protein [Rhodoferax ferrireducens]MDR7376981.1 methyl-accepting chemotaxis protein [Rhodoferax ferrireducens]
MPSPSRLKSLSISSRLGLGFGCMLVLVIAVAAVGQISAGMVNGQMRQITGTNATKTRLVNSMLESVSTLGIQSRSAAMLTEIDTKHSAELVKQVQQTLEQYDKREAALTELFKAADTTPAEQKLLKDIADIGRKTRPDLMEAIKASVDGDSVAATTGLMSRVDPSETIWRAKLAELIELQNSLNNDTTVSAEQTQSRARLTGGLLVLLSLALGGLIAWRITGSITQPIGRAVVVAERIARGDLTSQVEVRIHDETGRLLEAIAAMQDRLRAMVGDIGQTAESIQVASAEVASGNLDLSQRTEQAASNLQGAATALSDLTGTVSHSAGSARQANQLAASASEVATRGGEVVLQVVKTMDEISTSSKKIADIISVIDGIAFQTNILALNAAVEAARAGEQGRGFAVVASEVRSLAVRAATAAREIKALIGSSVERVQVGNDLASHAGQTIQELVQSVKRVSDIMAEITSATEEQSQRIGSVSHSMEQLENVTQQNAALVEEGAAAADSLQDQAGKLTQMVHAFRLSRETTDGRAWQENAQPVAAPPVQAKPAAALARASVPALPRR